MPRGPLEDSMHMRRIPVLPAALLALTLITGCEAIQQFESQVGG